MAYQLALRVIKSAGWRRRAVAMIKTRRVSALTKANIARPGKSLDILSNAPDRRRAHMASSLGDFAASARRRALTKEAS